MKRFDFSKEFGNIDGKYIREAEGKWSEKKSTRVSSFWSKLAAACVILTLLVTVFSNDKVQAALKKITLSIGETLGFQREIESYTEILNTSRTDQNLAATLKEVILDEGVLLAEVHLEQVNSGKNQKEESQNSQNFYAIGMEIDSEKTTVNGQKLDTYGSGTYLPYLAEDLLSENIEEKQYDCVLESRFSPSLNLNENPEIHLVLSAIKTDELELKTVAEFSFDFRISREEIIKQTLHKKPANVSIRAEEGKVILKEITVNKLQSIISAEISNNFFQNYDVELRGTDSKGNPLSYEWRADGADDCHGSFQTSFWGIYEKDQDGNVKDQYLGVPAMDCEYLDLQLYVRKHDDEGERIEEDDGEYIIEEEFSSEIEEELQWNAVGEKIRVSLIG